MGWLFDAADVSILTLLLAPSVGNLLGTTDPRQIAPIGGGCADDARLRRGPGRGVVRASRALMRLVAQVRDAK